MRIVIGQGSCGIAAGAEKVRKALLNTNIDKGLITITGCIGMCYLEPIVDIYDDDNNVTRLVQVGENDAETI
ncbi:MAG: (2Fe-2S) ferredoxin domain-containing protein, partial [Ruminococcus sp.]|nr:(2Fe-2S) ferredoxin domain-containing protein [Ruminococcus sp.]